jgi:signal transduction histidine kinase
VLVIALFTTLPYGAPGTQTFGEKELVVYGLINTLGIVIMGAYETRVNRVLLKKLREERQHKTLFLGKMSHELRTPLVGIRGSWEVIQDYLPSPSESETVREVKKVVDSCFSNILQLIDDILDLSKLNAGRLALHFSSVPLRDVLRYAMNIVKPRAKEKNISLTLAGEDTLPECVWADQQRLTQILLNLLTNAVKFTEHGGVHVTASVEDPQTLEDPNRKFAPYL